VIRVYAEAGNVIETHEHTGDFKEWLSFALHARRATTRAAPPDGDVNLILTRFFTWIAMCLLTIAGLH
jgi:hypothetical protein